MKRTIFTAAILMAAALAFSQPMPTAGQGPASGGHGLMLGGSYVAAEVKAISAELGDKELGGLTLNELAPFQARLAFAGQKDAWVGRAAMMSIHLPGLGQFKTGDSLGGAGFLALHGGVVAGTLIGAYWLLPADLRFDQMDYLNSTHASIETSLKNHSFMDYLPSMAVLTAGALVDGGIRLWSAHGAAAEARAALDSGRVKLEPVFRPGFLGMGMHF